MQRLTIIVEGKPKTGKTSMSMLLFRLLSEAGLEVELDRDSEDYKEINSEAMHKMAKQCLEDPNFAGRFNNKW